MSFELYLLPFWVILTIYQYYTEEDMDYTLTKKQVKELLKGKLSHYFGVTPEEATYEQYYKALAIILRDMLRQGSKEFAENAENSGTKKIYYLCMEFLMGRSLKN